MQKIASARGQSYSAYLNNKVSATTAKVPSAPVHYGYGVVVNGFAAMLTPSELNAPRLYPSVNAITADEAMALDTSHTTSQFLRLGATGGAWLRFDAMGRAIEDEGVIVARIEVGVWPENVSVSDKVGANGKPVPHCAAGTVDYDPMLAGRYQSTCQVSEGFTAAMRNNKLVGAQVFNTTFLQVNAGKVWPGEYNSPRDEDGHGTHTLTTASGNANSPVVVGGSGFENSALRPARGWRLTRPATCTSTSPMPVRTAAPSMTGWRPLTMRSPMA